MKKKPKELSPHEKSSRMRTAIQLTQAGMHTAKYYLKKEKYITELTLAAKIEYTMRMRGATWFSFPTIVSSSKFKNIHATPTCKRINKTDTVIVDIGAKFRGVCADMTRTFCLRPSKKVHSLYSLVKHAHEEAASHLAPRVKCRLVDKVARDIIKKAGYKIPHGVGHGVGIKVHQNPSLKPRSRHKLKIGQVVTIEPGVYLKNIGVRIEDIYLITKRGAKRLTNFPRKL